MLLGLDWYPSSCCPRQARGYSGLAWAGFVFGTAYNLVYLNWLLHLHPLNWMGLPDWQSVLMCTSAWLIVSLHQGLITAVFAGVLRLLPLGGGAVPRLVEEHWRLPSLVLVPLLWVLLLNKIGNAHDWLGVPWSMLEYSQYHQLAILQVVSLTGGIGLGALIVLVNVTCAGIIATFTERLSLKPLAFSSRG